VGEFVSRDYWVGYYWVVVCRVWLRLAMRSLVSLRLYESCSRVFIGLVLVLIGWWVSDVGCWISVLMLLSEMVWVMSWMLDVIVCVVLVLLCILKVSRLFGLVC